jgi:hypothetical protein
MKILSLAVLELKQADRHNQAYKRSFHTHCVKNTCQQKKKIFKRKPEQKELNRLTTQELVHKSLILTVFTLDICGCCICI